MRNAYAVPYFFLREFSFFTHFFKAFTFHNVTAFLSLQIATLCYGYSICNLKLLVNSLCNFFLHLFV